MEPLISLVLNNTDFLNFMIGCIGAFAPEAYRLYNLRTEPELEWSWQYFLFSIPFIIVGGFIAWSLDPQTKWAAFYGGLSAPLLITTVMKDIAKAEKDIAKAEKELAPVENSVEKPREILYNTGVRRDGHPGRTTGAGTPLWGGINTYNFQNFLKGI